MSQPRVQMTGRRWIPNVARELVNVFGYRYAQAYRRTVKTSSGAREAVQWASLCETMFSRLALTLSECEGLLARDRRLPAVR